MSGFSIQNFMNVQEQYDVRDEGGVDVVSKQETSNGQLPIMHTSGFLAGCRTETKIDTGPYDSGDSYADTDTDTDADTDTDMDTDGDVDTGETGETGETGIGDTGETGLGDTGDTSDTGDTADTADTGLITPEELKHLSTSETDAVFYGEVEGDQAGYSVSFAGDVDGDGSGDVFIGAPSAYANDMNPGSAYLMSGPITAASYNLADATAIITGLTDNQQIGKAIDGPGDVNGDGFSDLLVGDYASNYYSGAAHLYLGPVTGALTTADADVSLEGLTGNAYGFTAKGVGDLNGSGYSNVAVSEAGASLVYLYPDFATASTADEAYMLEGYNGSYAGNAIAGIGDANGDGLNDVVVGAYQDDMGASNAGAAYYVPGDGTLVSGAVANLYDVGEAFTGEVAGDYAGYSVASAGDTNYDGYQDFIVGAPNNGLESGAAYVVLGGSSLTSDTLSNAAARLYGNANYDYAGWSVSGGGSVNGDEFDDVVIGVKNSDATVSNGGETFVMLGPVSGYYQLDSSSVDLTTSTYINGVEEDGYLGASLSTLSDVDGDGTADLLMGEPGNYSGAAHLILGSSF